VYLLLPTLDTASTKQADPVFMSELTIIENNSLVAMISPVIEEKLVYDALIAKLCHCESTSDPTKINQNDMGSPSYGILQFKVPTFYNFCVVKYGLANDLMNPDVQKKCADEMLKEDFDNVWNWANCWNKIRN